MHRTSMLQRSGTSGGVFGSLKALWKLKLQGAPATLASLALPSEAAMNAEVKSIRRDHNFSPENAIQGVSVVLWRYVDKDAFERVLKDISAEAELFWAERDRE